MAATSKKSSTGKSLSQEEIIEGFQELRNQQRGIVGKINELQADRKEHDLVIETLKECDPDRKAFRLVGGVLVERTVKEVLPALQQNFEGMGQVISQLEKQVEQKGQELNAYREKHGLKIRGEEDSSSDSKDPQNSKTNTSGVLVEQGQGS